jgi:hypothetical protein
LARERRTVPCAGERLRDHGRRQLLVSRPGYAERDRVEPVPAGLEAEQRRDYLGLMSGHHSIDLDAGVVSNGTKSLDVGADAPVGGVRH